MRWLRVFFLTAQPPLLGEEGKGAKFDVEQHARRPWSQRRAKQSYTRVAIVFGSDVLGMSQISYEISYAGDQKKNSTQEQED
jgi:hypothetical protein